MTRFHALRKAGFDFPVASDVDDQNQNGLTAVIYDKGALAVRQLATEMGKDAFDEALREYARRYRHRFTDTAQFLAHLEERRPGMRSAGEQVLTTDRYRRLRRGRRGARGERGPDHDPRPPRQRPDHLGQGGRWRKMAQSERTLDFTVRGAEVLEDGRPRAQRGDRPGVVHARRRPQEQPPPAQGQLGAPPAQPPRSRPGRHRPAPVRAVSGYAAPGGRGRLPVYRDGVVRTERRGRRTGRAGRARRVARGPSRGRAGRPMPRRSSRCRAARTPGPSSRGTARKTGAAHSHSGGRCARRWRSAPGRPGTTAACRWRPGSMSINARRWSRGSGWTRCGCPAPFPTWHRCGSGSRCCRATAPGRCNRAWRRRCRCASCRACTWCRASTWAPTGGCSASAARRRKAWRAGCAPATGARPARQPATGRVHGGLDLLVPLVGGREDRLLDLVVFRSLTAALYFEAENRFTAFPALGDGREWSPHAGIELSAGFTSLIDLPMALAGGLDVPLRAAGDPSTWRFFLSANAAAPPLHPCCWPIERAAKHYASGNQTVMGWLPRLCQAKYGIIRIGTGSRSPASPRR